MTSPKLGLVVEDESMELSCTFNSCMTRKGLHDNLCGYNATTCICHPKCAEFFCSTVAVVFIVGNKH